MSSASQGWLDGGTGEANPNVSHLPKSRLSSRADELIRSTVGDAQWERNKKRQEQNIKVTNFLVPDLM
jgi:hypothetical protein